ncbi:MAG: hypothetical protein JSV64_05045 [Candidatus Bathyarchaeota archaeon]|nr:MAG: hypothetical protein JSV64_05045 [Candidatus Bathyarchaeota archaeon]
MEVPLVSESIEIRAEGLKAWLEREAAKSLLPLNKQGARITEKIEARLSDVRRACEKLAEEAKKETEKGRAARKSKATEKLSRYFLKQIDAIGFPDDMTFSELNKAHRDSKKMLSLVSRERAVWFPRISPLFILARRRVDFAFVRLTNEISTLGKFLSDDYVRARDIEKLLSESDEIARLQDALNRVDRRKSVVANRLQTVQSEIEESQRGIEDAENIEQLGELTEINQTIQMLASKVKHEIRHLEKPFIKFLNLRSAAYPLGSGEVERLNMYLKDPFTALAMEEDGYPILKSILLKIEHAINESKLKLKRSRLRKALEEIDAILRNHKLEALQKDCSKAFSLRKRLISTDETAAAKRALKELHGKLAELQRRKKSIEARFSRVENQRFELIGKLGEQKKIIEDLVCEVLEKKINLRF